MFCMFCVGLGDVPLEGIGTQTFAGFFNLGSVPLHVADKLLRVGWLPAWIIRWIAVSRAMTVLPPTASDTK